MNNFQFMEQALVYAKQGAKKDCVPVGCVLIYDQKIIAGAHNWQAPFEHAELLVIQESYHKIGEKIRNATLYVTLEPCSMCASMIALCHIQKTVFGAYDTKNGGVEHTCQIPIQNAIGGVMEEACGELLSKYFQGKRV